MVGHQSFKFPRTNDQRTSPWATSRKEVAPKLAAVRNSRLPRKLAAFRNSRLLMEGGDYRHVLVVPCIGDSHINGMLRFAIRLATAHHHQGLLVSFGYPARSHALALKRNKLGPLPPSLRLHILDDGLPTAEHETPTIPQLRGSNAIMQNAIEVLFQQYVAPTDQQACAYNEKGSSPASVVHSSTTWPPICCIISDTFLPDMQDLTEKFGIPRVDLWTGSATSYCMLVYLPEIIARGLLPLPKGKGDKWKVEAPLIDFIPGLPAFHVTDLPKELIETCDDSDTRFQFILKSFGCAKRADRILIHSVYELERGVYDTMQAQGFPIYPVGPLIEANPRTAVSRSKCIDWLDQQEPASVIYVAFGTIATLNLKEMHAMAVGLESSGHLFLWVIREDSLPVATLHESLPEGFMERTISRGKGLIVTWAPQMEVLKHVAVGAFISHCGWNSVLESLWEGVPMVACPRAAEQRCNMKSVVEDWKVGVEMEREDDGSFTKEAVQKSLEEIMGNQEVKEGALHFKQVVRQATSPEGTSHSNIVRFVDHLFHLPVPSSKGGA